MFGLFTAAGIIYGCYKVVTTVNQVVYVITGTISYTSGFYNYFFTRKKIENQVLVMVDGENDWTLIHQY